MTRVVTLQDERAQKQLGAKLKPIVKKNSTVQESTDPFSETLKASLCLPSSLILTVPPSGFQDAADLHGPEQVKKAIGRQKRKRILVDHNRVSEVIEAETDNEYERQVKQLNVACKSTLLAVLLVPKRNSLDSDNALKFAATFTRHTMY